MKIFGMVVVSLGIAVCLLAVLLALVGNGETEAIKSIGLAIAALGIVGAGAALLRSAR